MMNRLVRTDVNNQVYICGEVVSDLEFSHEYRKEVFYECKVKIPRLSGASDILPVTISERHICSMQKGQPLCALAQLRSYNKMIDGHSRLALTVFVREVLREPISYNPNQIFLYGYICKPPIYRTTPLGRELTDMLLAVNRAYNKSDYIPSISWGRNARFAADLHIGDRIGVTGRIQSREYKKAMPEGHGYETFTTYEISISKIAAISDKGMNRSLFEQFGVCS